MSPKILQIAHYALIISGIVLIAVPLLIKFGMMEGKFETTHLTMGIVFLVLGILSKRRFDKNAS